VTEKVYTPRVGQACGEGESVGSGNKWFLGENPPYFTVFFMYFLPSLGFLTRWSLVPARG
jgi:hypothetical protein